MAEITNIIEDLRLNQHRDSTKRTYYTVWRLFNRFFIRLVKKPQPWGDRLTLFVGYLIQKKKQSTTIKSYISAIKAVLKMHKIRIREDEYLLASLTRACKLKNDRLRIRLPIQKGMLCILLKQIDKHFLETMNQPYLADMYKALISTMYFGLFRISEMTSGTHPVLAHDVFVGENKDKFLLILRSSKTHDKSMPLQMVKISSSPTNNSQHDQKDDRPRLPCPYDLLDIYSKRRGCFCSMSEPFFIFADGSPVKPQHLSSCLKMMIRQAGFDASLFGSHSLRIGRTCDLFKLGLSVETIKKIGHWRSNAILRYLKT